MSSRGIKTGSRPVVVIEAGGDCLKMIKAVSSRGQVSVEDLHLQRFEGGVISPEAVSKAARQMDLEGAVVVGCLPRQWVNIRTLELPSTDPDEIADMVDFQAAKQTPYSKDEILSDYKIIGSDRQGYTKIMLVIVQRGVLRQYFHIFEEAGIDVERMSVSAEGISGWFRHAVSGKKPDGSATAVVDIDTLHSDFMVVARGNVVFTRCIRLGANQLLGGQESARTELMQEMRPLLETWRTESPGLILDKMLLTGAGSRLEGLKDYLSAALNLSVETADETGVVKKMPKAPSVHDPAFRGVSLTPLIGMALSPESLEIGLIPDSVKLRKDLVRRAGSLAAMGMAVMTVLISVSFFVTTKFSVTQRGLAELVRREKQVEPTIQSVQRMHAIVKLVKKYRDPRNAMVNVLAEINPLVPQDVSFEAVDIDVGKSRISIGGSGGSMKDVRSLMNGLEASPFFADVKEDGSGMSKDPKTGRFRFKIACILERPK